MSRSSRYIQITLLSLCLGAFGSSVSAQDLYPPEVEQDGRPGEALRAPTADQSGTLDRVVATDEPVPVLPSTDQADQETWPIIVHVRHGAAEDEDLSGLPVILHALRRRGPFESGTPAPARSWTSITDRHGRATFHVDVATASSGLLLQAHVTYGGVSFQSSELRPARELQIPATVYDLGHDLSGLRITQKRVVVEPWEEYLIFSQFWTFVLEGDQAVDIALSPDPALERGLALRLPVQAEGIHFSGPGDHEVINNLVFWTGVLQPNQPVHFQIRFSKSVRGSELTHRQVMEFPVDEVQVIAPLQTQYQKMPRLDDLVLIAPGFEVSSDASHLGLRTDMDFLVATGRTLEAGEAYTFRVGGLPFRRPTGGWLSLLGGLLGAIIILLFGRKEFLNLKADRTKEKLLSALKIQKEEFLAELRQIKEDLKGEELDEEFVLQLEDEEALLRERLALILRRIRDLEET